MLTYPTMVKVHFMKLGQANAYCGRATVKIAVAYDDWSKVDCEACLNAGADANLLHPKSILYHRAAVQERESAGTDARP